MSVAEQTNKSDSLLNVYRRLSALRSKHRMLAGGTTRVVAQQGDLVLISRQSGAGEALVLFNFGSASVTADLPLPARTVRRYGDAKLQRSGTRSRISAPAYSATVWTVAR